MQSVQSINSWEQFLKLKNQAIQRNRGLAGFEHKIQKQSANNVNSYKRELNELPAVPKHATFQSGSATVSGKALGCNFDAYA